MSQTFLIAYKDMCKAGVARRAASGVKKFLTYGAGRRPGRCVKQLSYAPLPATLLSKDNAQLKR